MADHTAEMHGQINTAIVLRDSEYACTVWKHEINKLCKTNPHSIYYFRIYVGPLNYFIHYSGGDGLNKPKMMIQGEGVS